ncbi:KOW domain-containing RNA-binding protein [Oscillospiraceae bacterium LTW-04]|nr:KOW domain-containing RNA-binding protein [Oscillospiraceae bacterium MB24-C1]
MCPGMVVKALAGRDADQWFAVLSVEGDFALIVNGKSRPLARPKRKRRKHLAVTTAKLSDNCMMTDRKLKCALRAFAANCDKEGNDLGKG